MDAVPLAWYFNEKSWGDDADIYQWGDEIKLVLKIEYVGVG